MKNKSQHSWMVHIMKINVLILFILLSSSTYSQVVSAPPDVTIACGGSTTLAATTTAVTYSVVATSCPTENIAPSTVIFSQGGNNCDDCVSGDISI